MATIAKFPSKGLPPLSEPVAGFAIEELLEVERAIRSEAHEAERSDDPARLIASDAYSCARKVAFGRLGVPKDITYDAQALMTFRAGDWYHEVVQRALIRYFPDARTEVDFDWRAAKPPRSLYGKCDAVYDGAAVEIKSMAGFGFDLATGARRSSEGPGPKIDHLIQAGLAALSPQIEADRVHLIYLNKDRGAVAEWLIGVDDELPHLAEAGAPDELPTIRGLVTAELRRLEDDVLKVIDAGHLPARRIPGYGLVEGTPPEAGSRGDPWNCRYCSWQPTCAALPDSGLIVKGWAKTFAKQGEAS